VNGGLNFISVIPHGAVMLFSTSFTKTFKAHMPPLIDCDSGIMNEMPTMKGRMGRTKPALKITALGALPRVVRCSCIKVVVRAPTRFRKDGKVSVMED
jgi:hypothetical protein